MIEDHIISPEHADGDNRDEGCLFENEHYEGYYNGDVEPDRLDLWARELWTNKQSRITTQGNVSISEKSKFQEAKYIEGQLPNTERAGEDARQMPDMMKYGDSRGAGAKADRLDLAVRHTLPHEKLHIFKEDSVHDVLLKTLGKHEIEDDGGYYRLYIDSEVGKRMFGINEKPLLACQQLVRQGMNLLPEFRIRKTVVLL